MRPFQAVPLAHLPEPIGRAGDGRPSVLTVYDTMRRTILTLGVYHEKGLPGHKFELCVCKPVESYL